MNELQEMRTLTVVAAEINALTANMLCGVIEIGRRMCEAKQMVPYGTFGDWIKENTGYSSSTANNFMRLYKEYGDRQSNLFGAETESQTIGKLSYTKALALLSVPENERESFAQEVNAEHISTRELEQAIRERDEARKELNEEREAGEGAAMKIADLQSALEKANEEAGKAIEKAEQCEDELEKAEKRIRELQDKPVDVAVQTVDASEEQIKKAKEEAIAEAEKEKKKLMRELTKAQEEASAAMAKLNVEKEEAQRRIAAAEKKAVESAESAEVEKYRQEAESLKKQLAMSGESVTIFKLHFSAWQKAFNEMEQAMSKVDAETAEKLKAATKAQVQAWTEKLS